jgi:hypothetical protein
MPVRFSVISFLLVVSASVSACSGGGADDNGATGGVSFGGTTGFLVPNGPGGGITSGGTGVTSALQTGGSGNTPAVGSSTVASGSRACIPAATQIPDDHATEGFDTKPCSACHNSSISGGFVVDSTGSAPISHATVTLTSTNGTQRTAVTTSNGMFAFPGAILAPYEACVSKCPDTVCSKTTDHPNANDCGTCHGVTTTKIHLP